MKSCIHWGFIISACLYTLINFIEFFYHAEWLLHSLSMVGLLALLLALLYNDLKKLALPLFIIIIAIVVNITSIEGSMLQNVWEGIRQMRSLISLLLIVPIVSWVLNEEPYIEEVVAFLRNILNSSRLFFVSMMSITQIISYFLLFGAIPIVYQFIQSILKNKKGEEWQHFKSTAVLRGFALSTIWVISIPSFAFAVESAGASLPLTILQGFFISIGGIFLSVLFAYFEEKKYGVNLSAELQKEIDRVIPHTTNGKLPSRRVIEFITLFFSLFGTVLVINGLVEWDLLMIIPLVILIWTFSYFVIKHKFHTLIQKSKQYLSQGIAKKSQEFSILFSAGLLIYSLHVSGLGDVIFNGIFYLTNTYPFLNTLMILPLVLIILGFLGLGPLTVMVLVGGILQHVHLPYPPELIVLSLTLGSAITIMLSPLIMPLIVLSASNGLSIFKNGFKFNLGYAFAFYLFVEVYIQLMVFFFY
jgi:hypothetical protein